MVFASAYFVCDSEGMTCKAEAQFIYTDSGDQHGSDEKSRTTRAREPEGCRMLG